MIKTLRITTVPYEIRTICQLNPSIYPGNLMFVTGQQLSSQKLQVHSERGYAFKSSGRFSSTLVSQGYILLIILLPGSLEYLNVISVFPVCTAFVPINCMNPGADCPEASVATKGFFLQA